MTKRSITSGLPPDQREFYRLLLRYPILSFTILCGLLGAGFTAGQFYSKVDNNNKENVSTLDVLKEIKEARNEAKNECDSLVAQYKIMLNKIDPKLTKNENK